MARVTVLRISAESVEIRVAVVVTVVKAALAGVALASIAPHDSAAISLIARCVAEENGRVTVIGEGWERAASVGQILRVAPRLAQLLSITTASRYMSWLAKQRGAPLHASQRL